MPESVRDEIGWRLKGRDVGQVLTGVAALGALALSPFLAFAVEPLASAPFWPSGPAPNREARLGENSRHLGSHAVGNVAVLEQRKGFLVIDGGGSAADGRRAVRFIRGISDKPVRTLVLGGARGAEVASIVEIRRAWPDAQIVAAGRNGGALFGGGATPRYRLQP